MFGYIGGKSKIGKWIFENMPKVKWKKYIEVFGGAMWVYIRRDIQAEEIIYNDYNPFLYNLWLCMIDNRKELGESIYDLEPNNLEIFKENKAFIKEVEKLNKNEFLDTTPNIEVASKYIYLVTHCFSGDISGGMKRTQNTLRSFYNKLQNPIYTNKLDNISEVLCMDCEELIEKHDDKEIFMYVDPPYYGKEHLYGFHNFSLEKHYSLAEKLKKTKCYWILSYYDYEDLRMLYPENDYVWMRKRYLRSSSPIIGKPGKGEEVIVFPKSMDNKKYKNLDLFFT